MKRWVSKADVGGDAVRPRASLWLMAGAVLVAVLFWMLEALMDSLLGLGPFTSRILPPDPNEVWMRTIIVTLVMLFGTLAAYAVRLYGQAEGEIRHLNEVLERRVARRTARLEESEGRFRALADNISQLAWMTDERGSVSWYNKRWFDYTGTTPEEMQGAGWRRVHHPSHVERVAERVRRSEETGEPWEDTFPLRGADGTYRWFLSRAVPIKEAGKVVRWFGTNTDITEARAAEEALRESHTLLDSLVEGTADAVFVKDLEGRYLLVNSVAARIIGGSESTAKSILGRDDTEFFAPEVAGPIMELDRMIIEGDEAITAEESVPFDGEERTFLSTKAPYKDHRGEVVGLIGVATDITERKRAEKAIFDIREAERQRIARDLHDVVLHHIVGALQTMQATHLEGNPGQEREIDALRRAVRGLRDAIYDLRLEQNEPFVRAVESFVDLNRQLAPGCRFVVAADRKFPERLPGETNVELLRTVQEALTNARRHSGAQTIEVRLGGGEDGEVLVEVADDGRGFDEDVASGGIGLSAMRERARIMGADLEVESVAGQGTRVRVRVPVRGSPPGR